MPSPDLIIHVPGRRPIRHRWTAGLFLLAAGLVAGVALASVIFGAYDVAAGTACSATALAASSYLVAGRRWHPGAVRAAVVIALIVAVALVLATLSLVAKDLR